MKKNRVLIVDDEPTLARGLKRILLEHYHAEAALPEEALQTIQDNDYDCILCDVTMPGLSGPELLEKVRHHKPSAIRAFLFHTGSPEKIQHLGIPYVEKPAPVAAILSSIRRLITRNVAGPDPLAALTPEQMDKIPRLSDEEVQEALLEGAKEVDAAEQSQRHRMPPRFKVT